MEYNYGYDPSLAVGNSPTTALSSIILIIYLISIIGTIVSVIAMWKIYTKAGKPGWASIIPIYNIVVLFEIVELEWWHVLIAIFVPFAMFIYLIVVNIKLAKVFGKGTGFTLLLIFIPVVGQLMLAFGNATYNGQVDYVVNNMGMNMNNQNNMGNINGMNNMSNMNNMNNVNSVNNNINNGRDYSAMNVNNDDHYYNAELDHMSQKQINEMVKNNMQMEQNNNQMNNNQFINQNNTLNNNQFNTQGVPMDNMMNNQVNEQSIIQEEQRLDNQTGTKPCPVCGSNQVATARECSICGHKFM